MVKQRALAIFRRIAEAEGKIHGQSVDEVHFHEVGALDSIADIVCACVGIEALRWRRSSSPRCTKATAGSIARMAAFRCPAPATLEILKGIPLGQIDEPHEMITPTGAAIAAEFAAGFGLMPTLGDHENRLRPRGARSRHAPECAARRARGTCLTTMPDGHDTDTVTRLETNLDDCPAEYLGAAMEKLLAAGALDVWFTPIQMKKHRPGTMLSVLCAPEDADRMADLIFTETTAFGLRRENIVRLKLLRRFETVRTKFGDVTVKLGLKGDAVVQVAPEFESCRAASERAGVSIRTVCDSALQCFAIKDQAGSASNL